MIISDAIAMIEHDLQARHDCPENYDPDFTRALETVLKDNTRLTEENISLRADVQILRNQLVKAKVVLEQCQDCIRGETPEDMTDQEAREDTISKIREVLFTDDLGEK